MTTHCHYSLMQEYEAIPSFLVISVRTLMSECYEALKIKSNFLSLYSFAYYMLLLWLQQKKQLVM
jgi:hypothetical protein